MFPTLEPAQIARIGAHGRVRQFRRGEVLIEAGEQVVPFFVVTAGTVRELVKERPLYRHERAVGLSPGAYLGAKVVVFTVCGALTLLAVVVAFLPTGPLLLVVLLFVAAGTLGFYPNYYSFTQDLSKTHQGKITGILSTIAWAGTSPLQRLAGQSIDATKSYATGIMVAGLAPLVALLALGLLWEKTPRATPRWPQAR